MKKTITITDPMQVKIGDKAYFKGCDFGFTVIKVDEDDMAMPIKVSTPFDCLYHWTLSSRFDHATREVEKPEWPDPHDLKLHVYLGADGNRYIYNPGIEQDTCPWTVENSIHSVDRQQMASVFTEALPLTELKLVPAKDDDNE